MTAVSRRGLLALGLLAATARARAAAAPAGAVDPAPVAPALPLTDAQGRETTLVDLLRGRPTAVQMMFTTCSSTCPTQGQLFSLLAARARSTGVHWLSLSIDALGDDAARLAAWQSRFGAVAPSWRAAVPRPADADRLCSFLRGGEQRAISHTTQVFAFDRRARLVWRTGDLPAAAEVEALMTRVAAIA